MIGSKSKRQQAEEKVSDLEQKVTQWEAAQAIALSEADDLDARLGTEVMDADTDQDGVADRLAAQVATLQTKARVAAKTAGVARDRLVSARRHYFVTVAEGYEAQAEKARRPLQAHRQKVDAALLELRKLDGIAYQVKLTDREYLPGFGPTDMYSKNAADKAQALGVFVKLSVTETLQREADRLAAFAELVRMTLAADGAVPFLVAGDPLRVYGWPEELGSAGDNVLTGEDVLVDQEAWTVVTRPRPLFV